MMYAAKRNRKFVAYLAHETAIRRALETAGIDIIESNGEGGRLTFSEAAKARKAK
jgi:hypothetical protein